MITLTVAQFALPAAAACFLGYRIACFARAPAAMKRNYPLAWKARSRWKWLTKACGLVLADGHQTVIERKVIGPRLVSGERVKKPRQKTRTAGVKIRPTIHGIEARVKTVPTVSREQFEKQSQHIADYWRCGRVAVTQPKPGRLLIRGLRTDPLELGLAIGDAPAGTYDGTDLTRVYIGRDEFGSHRYLRMAGNTALTAAGLPGSGKSSMASSLALQWCPTPLVQFAACDGKDSFDWEPWRGRAWRVTGGDRQECADLLLDTVSLMKRRLRLVQDITGKRNAWNAPITEAMPIHVTILDECQRFLDLAAVKGDKDAEKLVQQCNALTQEIVRLGRSVLMVVVLLTQKATTDSMPSQIRDNAGLSHGVRAQDHRRRCGRVRQ